MKKTRFLALVLVFTLLLSLPAFATSNRASDQISLRNIDVNALSGQISVKATVVGLGTMSKIGCQSIYVYEQSGSFWLLTGYKSETNDGMVNTNAPGYANIHYFDSETDVEYKVVVTVFAENDAGRDSRTDIFYVTGK